MKRIENFVKNLSKDELEYLKSLINKPVETTNEQLKTCKYAYGMIGGVYKPHCIATKGTCKCHRSTEQHEELNDYGGA
jgi:hypothetical protein